MFLIQALPFVASLLYLITTAIVFVIAFVNKAVFHQYLLPQIYYASLFVFLSGYETQIKIILQEYC